MKKTTIGILSLQGGVLEHLEHFESIGIDAVPVKHPHEFANLAGLVIPGGESTCLGKLLRIFEIDVVIKKYNAEGMKVWGTCAGSILLATEVIASESHLGLIDMQIERNGFGSQLDSFKQQVMIPEVSSEQLSLTYIRAPKIHSVGKGCTILLENDDYIAAVENDSVLVTIFHPELTSCRAFHRYFAVKCGLSCKEVDNQEEWNRQSWMKYAKVKS